MFKPHNVLKLGPHFWQKLYCFYWVAHFQNLSQAALYLNISPSSVTKAVQALEFRFKAVLIERKSNRCLGLTKAGQEVFEKMQGFLSTLEQIQALIEGSTQRIPPRWIFKMPEWVFCDYVFEALHLFGQPFVDWFWQPALPEDALESRDEVISFEFKRSQNPSLIQKPLGLFESGIYASPRTLRQKGIPPSLRALSGHRLIGFESPDPILNEHLNWHRHHVDIDAKTDVLWLQNHLNCIRVAEEDGGFMAYFKNHPALKRSDLVEILEGHQGPQHTLYFICSDALWRRAEVKTLYNQCRLLFGNTK